MYYTDNTTKKLLDDIHKFKINYTLPKSPLLKKLHTKILKIYKSISISDIDYIKSTKLNHTLINQASFASDKIKEYIIKKYNICYIINYQNINLNYYTIKNLTKKDKDIILDMLKRVILVKQYFNDTSNISIHYWNTPFKKQLKKGILGPDEVNSGLRYYDNQWNTILLWRKEELYKVLLHEVIHAVKYDTFLYEDLTCENHLKSIFNINTNFACNEIITEGLANILNSIINTIDQNLTYNNFIKLYNNELKLGILQCAKLLHHNGFKSITQLYRKSYDTFEFKQNTNIASYYIFKIAILHNINGYLQVHNSLCVSKNKQLLIINLVIISMNTLFFKKVDKILAHAYNIPYNKSLRMSIN